MTDETMEARAIRALKLTWDAIAHDTLRCYADEQGKHIDRVVLTRDEVIDGVTACGFVGGYPAMYGQDHEAVEWLEQQPRGEQDRILRAAFPLDRYGT